MTDPDRIDQIWAFIGVLALSFLPFMIIVLRHWSKKDD